MHVVCAWCKKEFPEKAPYDDPSISHTICRDCSIKYWGVDPEEVKLKSLRSKEMPNPKTKGNITVDVDFEGPISNYTKRFGIKGRMSTASSALFTGSSKNIQRMLKVHYGSLSEAKEIHPEVFNNPYSTRAKYCHERIESPKKFDPRSYRTKTLGKGIKATFGCPKGSHSPRKGRCKTAMQMQRRLIPVGAKGCKVGGKAIRHNPTLKAYDVYWVDTKGAHIFTSVRAVNSEEAHIKLLDRKGDKVDYVMGVQLQRKSKPKSRR